MFTNGMCRNGATGIAKLRRDGFVSLNGKIFKLRFTADGKLYSFGFTDEKGDFGGAHTAGIVE